MTEEKQVQPNLNAVADAADGQRKATADEQAAMQDYYNKQAEEKMIAMAKHSEKLIATQVLQVIIQSGLPSGKSAFVDDIFAKAQEVIVTR